MHKVEFVTQFSCMVVVASCRVAIFLPVALVHSTLLIDLIILLDPINSLFKLVLLQPKTWLSRFNQWLFNRIQSIKVVYWWSGVSI